MASYPVIFASILAIKFAIILVPSSASKHSPPPDDYDDYGSEGEASPLAPYVMPPSASGKPKRPPSIHSNEPLEPNESFPPTPQGSPQRTHGHEPPLPAGHRPPSFHGSGPPSRRGSRTPSYQGSEPPSLHGSVPPSPGGSRPPSSHGSGRPSPRGHGPPVPVGRGPPSGYGSEGGSHYGSGELSPYGERAISPYHPGELTPVREAPPPRADRERGEYSFGFWNPHERPLRPEGHLFVEKPEYRFTGPTGTNAVDVMIPSPTGERITRIEFISKQGIYSEGEEVKILGHTRNVDLIQVRVWSKPYTDIDFIVKCFTHN